MDSLLEPSLLLLTFLLCLLAVSGIANASLFHRLRQIRQRTEKKLAVKTATLAMLSHEIRNPLAGLVHVARALGCTPLDATQRELLETLDDSGNALLTLLDNTLQHTRLDADAFISQTGDFSLASLVKRLMVLFEPQAANKGLLLTSSIDCSLPAILHGDSGSLRQILSNLLGNAIKFTDSGIVKLQVERDNRSEHPYLVIFRVIDSGIGIPPALHEKVFNPFSQGLPSIQQQFGGAGLGLSISRQLARAIGGNIELHSEEGRGSTFTLTLPLQGQTLPTCQLYTLPEPARPARQPLRLLVVDDTEIHRIAMRSLLEAEGHSVTLTDTTDAALQYARNDHFDGILLDVHMPGMDSISAIRQLRATGNACGIIALSAWLDDHDIHRLLDAGVDAVCYKPLDPAIVHRALAGITQNIRSAGKIPGNGLSRRHGSRIS